MTKSLALATTPLALVTGGLQQETPIVDEFDIAMERALQQADEALAAVPDDSRQNLVERLEEEKQVAEQMLGKITQVNLKIEELRLKIKYWQKEYNRCHKEYGVSSPMTLAAKEAAKETGEKLQPKIDNLDKLKKSAEQKLEEKNALIEDLERELAPKPPVVTNVAEGLAQAAITAAEEKGQAQDVVPAAPQKKPFVLDLTGFKPRDGHHALVEWIKTLVEGSVNGFFPESFEMPMSKSGAGPKVKVKERSPVDGTEIEVEIPRYLCGAPACCTHHVDVPNRFAMMWVGDEKPMLVALCRNATQAFQGVAQHLRDTHRPVPNIIKYTGYEMAKGIHDQAVEEYKRQEAELAAALRAAGQSVPGGATGKTGRKLRRLIEQLGSVEAATAALATLEADRKARRLQISQQGPIGRQGDSGSSGGKGGKKGQKGQKGGKKKH